MLKRYKDSALGQKTSTWWICFWLAMIACNHTWPTRSTVINLNDGPACADVKHERTEP